MSFAEFLAKYYDFQPSMDGRAYVKGYMEAVQRYMDEVVMPYVKAHGPNPED